MMHLLRLLAVCLALLPLFLPATARPVAACSPISTYHPVGDSDVIVGGWLQGWRPTPDPPTWGGADTMHILIAMSVERVYKGTVPAQIDIASQLHRYRTAAGTAGEFTWPYSGVCIPFTRDPTGRYALLGLNQRTDGTYSAFIFSTFFLGAAPEGYAYEAELARLFSLRDEATLNLVDPRPCIPAPGEHACDAARASLWESDAAAWAARGVTDDSARLTETLGLRVAAGDPATIAGIAREMGRPYVQITRLRYVDKPLVFSPGCSIFAGMRPSCEGPEFVEITNLGGGAQDLTGWSLLSPLAKESLSVPDGLVLQPGKSCRVYSGAVRGDSCGGAAFPTRDVWPDAGGRAVLTDESLAVIAVDTRYSSGPDAQPPPPNLEGVRSGG